MNMRLLDSYVELGVAGMARAGKTSWFYGHVGAALLAGYFMNQEHELPEHVKEGIERTCESFRRQHPEWFAPPEPEEADPVLLKRVIKGLENNVKQLRTSGHGLALGVLALKALRQRPDLITPQIVDGLAAMLEGTTQDRPNRYWGIDNYFEVTAADVPDIPAYQDTLDMTRRTYGELHTVVPGRVIDGVMYHLAGETIHSITHAQALTDLERFGYDDLVSAGMANHRIQMYLNRQIPDFVLEDEVKEPAFVSLYDPQYWAKTYSDPHALKFPYAALDLLKRLPEAERAEAERNACKLLTIIP
jgi:hypothetical protein